MINTRHQLSAAGIMVANTGLGAAFVGESGDHFGALALFDEAALG